MPTSCSCPACSLPVHEQGHMTVLIPYTAAGLDPRTRASVEAFAPAGADVVWRELDPADFTAYARLLVEAWGWPGDLMIVEHDVSLRPYVVEELAACSQPWCGFPYAIGQQLLVCLGCTRFSAHLKAALPDLMARAAAVGSEQDGGGVPAGDWRRLDVRIAHLLEQLGHVRHAHWPPVEHHHIYPQGG